MACTCRLAALVLSTSPKFCRVGFDARSRGEQRLWVLDQPQAGACTPIQVLLCASPPQPRAAMDVSQPLLLPIMHRVSGAGDELPGMPHPPT